MIELNKILFEQNENPVRIEENLVQKNTTKDKTRFYTVQLGDSRLILSKTNNSNYSEAQQKKIFDQLYQMEQQKKLYYQIVETEEPLVGSKSGISEDALNRIRGGDLGKGSSPGARAMNEARKASTNRPIAAKSKPGGSIFAEAWAPNTSKRSRPAAANRLADQFQTGPAEGRNGLLGRFSARTTPDPSNPGCAGGPRSVTVLPGQRNPDSSTEHEPTAYDGVKGRLTNKSENHLTSKHGHQFAVDDPLPPNPNQKPTKYKQVRTRLNNENKAKVRREIKRILSNPKTDVYTEVSIRGIQGRVYHCKETGRIVGIHTEGEFAGQIMKAQPISKRQLEFLCELNILD